MPTGSWRQNKRLPYWKPFVRCVITKYGLLRTVGFSSPHTGKTEQADQTEPSPIRAVIVAVHRVSPDIIRRIIAPGRVVIIHIADVRIVSISRSGQNQHCGNQCCNEHCGQTLFQRKAPPELVTTSRKFPENQDLYAAGNFLCSILKICFMLFY